MERIVRTGGFMRERMTSSPTSDPMTFEGLGDSESELDVLKRDQLETFHRTEPFPGASAFSLYLAHNELPSVYLVEDDVFVRRSTAAVLRDIGFEVHPYNSGIDLLQSISSELTTVRFLFSDYHMPYLSGYGLSQKVRRIWPDAKVLLMSGDSESSIVGEWVPSDWPMFIPKPFTYDELTQKLRELFHEELVEGVA